MLEIYVSFGFGCGVNLEIIIRIGNVDRITKFHTDIFHTEKFVDMILVNVPESVRSVKGKMNARFTGALDTSSYFW